MTHRSSSSEPASAADFSRELAALATERERFLREGTLADVFAVAYFHLTKRISELPLRYPEVTAAQIRGFYAAYTQRESLAHWRPYLELAGTRRLKRSTDPGALLQALLERAMIPHILYDLPPALRATRPEMLSWEALAPDFFALDPLFDRAAHATLLDFDHATRRLGALRSTHREALEQGRLHIKSEVF
ncbi:hypothetical protein [Armatimonas sp.]|uniref:hypothetical protein n=1 Tax=Armatimonas sp. TaxID=1872638 RepID=UPI00286CBE49|nr:hypothetical protein [Armatimonas sp.]